MLTLSLLIISLLLLANLIIEYQLALNNTFEVRNNRKRIHTWWFICAICIAVLSAGEWALTGFIYALIYWAAFESSKLLRLRINVIKVTVFSAALIAYHVLIIQFADFSSVFFVIPLLAFLASLAALHRFPRITALGASLVLVLCITSIFSIYIIWQRCTSMHCDAALVILFLFFITACNDIFQYLVGKTLGRRPLARSLSEYKTREGAFGGVLLTLVFSLLTMPHIVNVSILNAALIGAFIAILGIVGDLNISYLKRRANVKDSGTSLPGHGGLLDRIDSLILTAPGFGVCLSLLSAQ